MGPRRSLLPLAWCALALSPGCFFSQYEPGTLTAAAGDPTTRALTVGCLDVAVRTTKDAQVPLTHPVLRFALGNRCPYAVPVRFDRVRVAGLYAQGTVQLDLVDPRHEVHDAMLDGHASAHEALEFAPMLPHPTGPASVCVTLTGFTTADVTDAQSTRCFVFASEPAGGVS